MCTSITCARKSICPAPSSCFTPCAGSVLLLLRRYEIAPRSADAVVHLGLRGRGGHIYDFHLPPPGFAFATRHVPAREQDKSKLDFARQLLGGGGAGDHGRGAS